jgi:hypothetical protein
MSGKKFQSRRATEIQYPTTKHLQEIGRLSGQWGILASMQNALSELVRINYELTNRDSEKFRDVVLPPAGLKKIEKEIDRLERRKRALGAAIVKAEHGRLPRRPRGRTPDPYILVRDLYIRMMEGQSDKLICERLDVELLAPDDRLPLGFPRAWADKFDVRSYAAAYRKLECRPLIQKMISKAKGGRLFFWI